MTRFRRAISILVTILRRNRTERQLDDEMRTYVEMAARVKMRDGLTEVDAMRQAKLDLGGVESVKERVRTERHGHVINEWIRDVRYTLRVLTRAPGFSAVILLTLGLGIGANTAIFSLLDALMLRSLAVHHPGELVLVNLRARTSLSSGGDSFSWAIVRSLDERRDLLAGAGGFSSSTMDVGSASATTRVQGALVTGSFYQTLGLRAQAGRLLTPEDDQPGAEMAAVISDGYWTREFARSPDAIGRTLRVNGVPVAIVGVSPRGFDGANVGQLADISMAVAALPHISPSMADLLKPGNFWLRVLARPAPGISAPEAAARLNARWPALADSLIPNYWPATRRTAMADSLFVFEPGATGWTRLREEYERPLLVLMAVAGVVLLIACANIASLFLARASTRRHEVAVRLALGAGRRRIIRQLMLEGAVLSVAGSIVGVGVAWVSGRLLVDLIALGGERVVFDLTPNWHVLEFSAALAMATGLLFGLAPAFQTRRTEPAFTEKDGDRTGTSRSRWLAPLVAVQVALSLVLVAGAGLFGRTLRNLQHVDPGFKAGGVFIAQLERGKWELVDELLSVARHVPGVHSAAAATHTPLSGSSWSEAIVPVDRRVPDNDNTRVIGVGPQFFETMGIPLLAGRDMAPTDGEGAPAVAIINQRYAEEYFPRQNPLGRRLTGTLASPAPQVEVIGVVGNTASDNLRRQLRPIVYVSRAQFGSYQTPTLVLRAATGAADGIRAVLRQRLPDKPVEIRWLSAQVDATIVQERLMATLAGGFGVLALVLSSVGLYGLLAYSVAQRSREIGIRMALGAKSSGVVRLVVLNGLKLVGVGFLLGYPAARAAGSYVASMLFGLAPSDPATMAGAMGLLVTAALVASYVPARRASCVDPLVALRHE